MEGSGAGVGHLYESFDAGRTWTDTSGDLPDVPVDDVLVLPSGGTVASTDLGVVFRATPTAGWQRLGANLPTTAALDLHAGPDGNLYVATHGRGIWRTPLKGL